VTLCAPVAEFHVPLLGDITVAFCLTVIHIMSFLLTTWSISELRGDVAELKGDVAELKGDVAELKGDVAELKGDVAELKGDVAELKRNVGEMDKKLDAVIEAQTKTDQALDTFQTKTDQALDTFQTKTDQALDTFQTKTDQALDTFQTKTDQALETLITKVTNIETANQRLPTAPDEKVEKAKQRMSNELTSKRTEFYANGADAADLLCVDEIVMQLNDETSSLYMSLDANFDENGNARMNADKLWVAFMRMTAKSIAKRKGGRSDP